MLRWYEAYFRVFSRLANSGQFVGKDQALMNMACVENDGLCMIVQPKPEVYGEWFYMIPFLLGDTPDDAPTAIMMLGARSS